MGDAVNDYQSSCCGASVSVEGGTTKYWACSECGEACDTYAKMPQPDGKNEQIAAAIYEALHRGVGTYWSGLSERQREDYLAAADRLIPLLASHPAPAPQGDALAREWCVKNLPSMWPAFEECVASLAALLASSAPVARVTPEVRARVWELMLATSPSPEERLDAIIALFTQPQAPGADRIAVARELIDIAGGRNMGVACGDLADYVIARDATVRAEAMEQAAQVADNERVADTGDEGDAGYNMACGHIAAAIRALAPAGENAHGR